MFAHPSGTHEDFETRMKDYNNPSMLYLHKALHGYKSILEMFTAELSSECLLSLPPPETIVLQMIDPKAESLAVVKARGSQIMLLGLVLFQIL
jgi:hypothetical protein